MAARKKTTTEDTEQIVVKQYTKEVILSMRKYKAYKDLLTISLEDKKYSADEVDAKLERVLNTKIK